MRGPAPRDLNFARFGLPEVARDAVPAIASAEVPALFTDFAAWLGVKLTRGQRVATLVAFDGLEPSDLPKEDRELARALFGDVLKFNRRARRVLVAVCGARAGKTYVLEALRLLHLALTVPITGLAPGEVASGPIVAPTLKLATQPLRYIQGAIATKPELSRMVVGEAHAAESITLARDGRLVEICIRSASGQGLAGRGFSLFGALVDETAMLQDEEHVASDIEIYRGIRPRLTLPGAQMIVASTPWGQRGLLYQLFAANHPNPSCAGLGDAPKNEGSAIAMHAATLTLHDTDEGLRETVEAEYATDPDNAAREYGAQFMAAGVHAFFDPTTIAKCIEDSIEIPFLPEPGDQVCSGGDLGFTKNSSALVITHRRGRNISVAEIVERKPEESVGLKPSEVVRGFAERIAAHHGSYLCADAHYKQTAIEHLGEAGLGFLEAPTTKADVYIPVRAAMREDRVRLPNHARLIRQLREVRIKYGSGGTVQITHPLWRTGEHGDIAEAFALAIYQAAGETVPAEKPVEGTPAAYEAEAKAMTDRRRQSVRRQQEGSSGFAGRWPGR